MFNVHSLLANLYLAQIRTPGSKTVSSVAGDTESGVMGFFMWLLDKMPLFFGALAVVFIFFILAAIVRKAVKRSLSTHDTEDQVVLLAGKAAYLATLILGFTIALEILGIDISPVVGLIGLGFGFAIQDIIKNFVCGALILIQEPFKIGDVIKVGEYLGKVEAIEARSTNIKTFDGQRVIVPNADMFSSSVTNFSSHPERRLEVVVGVHYDTDLNVASKVLMDTLVDNEEILINPKPTILFSEFADSSINISVKFWLEKTSSIFEVRSKLIMDIKHAFDLAGISIPYPIRTLDMQPTDKIVLESGKVETDSTPETLNNPLNNVSVVNKSNAPIDNVSYDNRFIAERSDLQNGNSNESELS